MDIERLNFELKNLYPLFLFHFKNLQKSSTLGMFFVRDKRTLSVLQVVGAWLTARDNITDNATRRL